MMNYSDRLHKVIPGGAHTYSRGDDQFPSNAPQILERAKGVYVYSPDGKKILDYGMALRAVGIEYANEEVNRAAIDEINKGNNLTRASTIELKAAELICDLIPHADMVKFAKNGSTVTSAAVKLARAFTGRKIVARCAQHPFFSYDDWFIGSTVMNHGVPEEVSASTLSFNYNDLESLKQIFEMYPNQVAAVILEPATAELPRADFFNGIRQLCDNFGAVFILDEMITGFRYDLKGAQNLFQIKPDLITYGKAMANGFSVAALVGKREIMSIGSTDKPGAKRLFLISSTHGAEMSSLGAFVKTVELYKQLNVTDHLWSYGKKLIQGVNQIAREEGIEEYFNFYGIDCSPSFVCKDQKKELSMGFRALFCQEMMKKNILMPWVSIAYGHKDSELDQTLEAVRFSLKTYQKALNSDLSSFLNGPPLKPVFRSHN